MKKSINNKKTYAKENNNNIKLFVAFALLASLFLLTFNLNHVNASSDDDSKSTACGNCKGYNADTIFNQNVTFVKDAAVDYFTDERLPQTVNSKKKLTLEEMINLKLIRNIVDSNGKSCSKTDSYVEVTKEQNEYVFKINLSCSDVVDYVLVHKGCATYCEDNKCESKTVEPDNNEYEYEYKKSYGCRMTDWSDWSDWSISREDITNFNYKREESKTEIEKETKIVEEDYTIETTFNCDQYEGYELLGELCVKCDAKLEDVDADLNPTTYNCDNYPDYELDETKTKCVKTETLIDEKPADKNKTTYNCDNYPDYELDSTGTKCVKSYDVTDTIDADENEPKYNCDNYPDYELDSTGTKCVKNTSEKDVQPANAVDSYNCDNYSSDYHYDDETNKCIKTFDDTETIDATAHYVQKTGCRIADCKITQKLDCSSGSCQMVDEKSCTYTPTPCDEYEIDYYYCPANYEHPSELVCTRQVTSQDIQEPQKVTTYNCNSYSADYVYDDSNKTCVKTTSGVDTIDADKDKPTYNCNNYPEYKLDSTGTKCVKTTNVTDEINADEDAPTYNCNNYPEYQLDSARKLCVKSYQVTDTIDADENPPTYNCDKHEGYTVYGDKCVKPVCENCTEEAEKVETQVCPEGYTDNGEKCVLETEEEKLVTYYRYSVRSCEGGTTDTQWSIDKNDWSLINQGFYRTGRSRILVITK